MTRIQSFFIKLKLGSTFATITRNDQLVKDHKLGQQVILEAKKRGIPVRENALLSVAYEK